MWLDTRTETTQSIHRIVVAIGVVLSHFHRFKLFETRFLCYLIFTFIGIMFKMTHIGDVANVAHLVTDVCEITEYDVESDGWTGMSQMGIAIDRRSAYIHTDVSFVEGFEHFFPSRQRIINIKSLFHNA